MLNRFGIALLVMLASCGASAASAGTAGSSVRVNGVPIELRTFVLAGDPEPLAARLDARWGARQAMPRGSARQVLGRQRGPFHETLTLSAGPRPGLSRAVVAVHDLRRASTPMPLPPLPLPVGARLLNVVQFVDPADAAATYTIEMPGAAAGALQRLWSVAAARGWRRIAAAGMPGDAGRAIWAQRGTRELALVARPAAGHARLVLLETRGAIAADVTGVSR